MTHPSAPCASSVLAYMSSTDVFARDAELTVDEVGDGNVNFVFRVTDGAHSVIVKQAAPYFKIVGTSHPLDVDRSRIESEALKIMAALVPGSVPDVLLHDPGAGVLVMEDLNPLTTMRNAMLARVRFPHFADQISTLLARLCFHTSDHAAPARKRELMTRFANPELCEITNKLIFTAPYYDDPSNRVHALLRPYLEKQFWPREDVRVAAALLKRKFQVCAECLIHGDLHTGSIFASATRTVAFDAEFATMGPAGFDIGKLIGNLVINHQCWRGRDVPAAEADAYRNHVLELIRDTYSGFQRKLEILLLEQAVDSIARSSDYRGRYLRSLFEDALGFCATTLVRRMFGLAQNADVEGIEHLERRAGVQIALLECAMDFLVHREHYQTIDDVVQRVRAAS